MPVRVSPSRIVQALEYLDKLKSGVGEAFAAAGPAIREQFAARGMLDPESERIAEATQALPSVRRQVGNLTSLDPQADSDPGLEMILGVMPGVGRAMAVRDLERARRAKDPTAAALAASNFLPVDRLIGALRHGMGRPPISQIDAYHGTADDFEVFDRQAGGRATGARSARQATWFVDKPKVAEGYAVHAAEDAPVLRQLQEAERLERIAQRSNKKQDWDRYNAAVVEAEKLDATKYDRRTANARLLEVDIPDETKFLEVNAEGKTPLQLAEENDIDSWLVQQLREARKQNKEGVKIVNLDDTAGGVNSPATHYAVFDPSGVKIKSKVKILERK